MPLEKSEKNLRNAQEIRFQEYRKYIEFNVRLIGMILTALLLMNIYRTYKVATYQYCEVHNGKITDAPN